MSIAFWAIAFLKFSNLSFYCFSVASQFKLTSTKKGVYILLRKGGNEASQKEC